MRAQMDELTAGGVPPGLVAWIDAPGYRFEGASGYASLAGDTPMPPEGAFRIGSITKMFTAVVMMQLAEEGVLSLDDPLALWLPDVAEQLPHGDQLKLRHLLGRYVYGKEAHFEPGAAVSLQQHQLHAVGHGGRGGRGGPGRGGIPHAHP